MKDLSENEIYKSPDFKKWYELMASKVIKKFKDQ